MSLLKKEIVKFFRNALLSYNNTKEGLGEGGDHGLDT